VKDEDVEGVHDVLEDLEPITIEDLAASETVRRAVGDDRALSLFENVEARKSGHPIERAHVSEDEAVVLAAGIPRLSDAVLVSTFGRLAGLIETPAGNIEKPAVIAAAQALGLDATVIEGSPPMAAARVEETEPPRSVAKEDQVLSQHSHRLWEIGELGSDSHRLPVAAEELARGSSRPDGSHSLVGSRRLPPVSGSSLDQVRHLGSRRII
jgi:hypothetical protein